MRQIGEMLRYSIRNECRPSEISHPRYDTFRVLARSAAWHSRLCVAAIAAPRSAWDSGSLQTAFSPTEPAGPIPKRRRQKTKTSPPRKMVFGNRNERLRLSEKHNENIEVFGGRQVTDRFPARWAIKKLITIAALIAPMRSSNTCQHLNRSDLDRRLAPGEPVARGAGLWADTVERLPPPHQLPQTCFVERHH
jgi:hypothetical protein